MSTTTEALQPPPNIAPPLPAVAGTAPQIDQLSRSNLSSIIVTLLIGVVLAILATVAARQVGNNPSSAWVLWLAVAVGGLGGLAHEIAQSGGKILFFERKLDGFYIGSLGGVILGAVAGILAARGFVIDPNTVRTAAQPGPVPLMFEIFLAGLALKGITEAAGGQTVPPVSGSSASSPTKKI